MIEYQKKIQNIAERLLNEKKVDVVLGFKKGTIPMMNQPCLVRVPDETQKLVWDSNCGINLTNYLTNRKERIGIIAKGCDTRNIVTHIVENKIKREQLVIIGVPCTGMIDKAKINGLMVNEIAEVSEHNQEITITDSRGATKTIQKKEVLQSNCSICKYKNPVIYDELVADLVPESKDIDRYEDIRKIESMASSEKFKFFEDMLSTCIRCYACRNACPLCYCPTCFVDESKPQWLGKGMDPIDIRTFHFLRAYHCAGRCTDCGSCERACPMDITVRQFTKKLEKDCVELFGWEAGLTLDKRPPLDHYKTNDPQSFIK
ncbi:MAG: 4Fe-4S dicluster domain-containing protein [Desulfobacterales bacterium]|nr:4Fe-4S dicluster domain-containing protein [Desulfobacterales bacterium]